MQQVHTYIHTYTYIHIVVKRDNRDKELKKLGKGRDEGRGDEWSGEGRDKEGRGDG